VTGGTGLVGRYIVEGLLAAGYAVAVAGRRAPDAGLFDRPIEFRPVTLDADADQAEAFIGFDVFVHAAFDHVPGRYRGGEGNDADGFSRANLAGSVALFEQAKRAGVRRCVFLSSRAVYDGVAEGRPLVETLTLQPTSLYGAVKLLTEEALAALSSALFCGTSLRLTGVYGNLRPNKWDGIFADFRAGRPVAARAGSEVHGRDVAEAVRLALEAEAVSVSGQSLNVSDLVTDTREILSVLKDASGCLHVLPEPADKAAVVEMVCDKIHAMGWRPGGPALLVQTVRELANS